MHSKAERERAAAESERWSRTEQLIALLVEVVSIKVAGKGLKKPIDIDRPGKKGHKAREGRNERRRAAETPADATPGPQGPLDASKPVTDPVASSPRPPTDAGIKHAIGVLRATSRSRKG